MDLRVGGQFSVVARTWFGSLLACVACELQQGKEGEGMDWMIIHGRMKRDQRTR